MSTKIGLVAFVLFGCMFEPILLMAATPEEEYFSMRDKYIRQFKDAPDLIDDRPALAELERRIKVIVGPINVEGFPEEGAINLQTLQEGVGFGMVDGLSFSSGHEYLFVTTEDILKKYLDAASALPGNLVELSKTAEFYLRAIGTGGSVTYFAEIPVKAAREASYAHAFLGLDSQDIGPFVPGEVFVFVSSGNRIFVVYSPATHIAEIPQCRSEWDEFYKKRLESLEIYRSSGLNNKKAFDDAVGYEDQGFEAYSRCYDREAKNQKYFSLLTAQAQSIVDRLQNAK